MEKRKNNKNDKFKREEREFEQKLIDLSRVTRVTKGGKQLSFRAALVIGDKKGKAGFGLGKSTDVSTAINKAMKQAKKDLVMVPIKNNTIPHEVIKKFGSGKVMIKPASDGKGIKAGGAMRVVFDLAGIPNITGKILGSNNKINTLYATFEALRELRGSKAAAPKEKKPFNKNDKKFPRKLDKKVTSKKREENKKVEVKEENKK